MRWSRSSKGVIPFLRVGGVGLIRQSAAYPAQSFNCNYKLLWSEVARRWYVGSRNTMAGQTNKAGSSDGTLTLDKVFVAVPAADSKAQASMIMGRIQAGISSSAQQFTQCSDSRAPLQEQLCNGRPRKEVFWIVYCSGRE